MNNHYIETISLFPEINTHLVELMESLSEDDLNQTTQFTTWKVRDILAHLLDTSIRRLSSERDGYVSAERVDIHSYHDLVRHITDLADRWALAFSGVSPKILFKLVSRYQDELVEYLQTLDLYKESRFPVSWAGETTSYNWFDIAREYTERWHHQMQIREALGMPNLYTKRLYFPVLDTFMQALPYHYHDKQEQNGYVLCVRVLGNAGGEWFLEWKNGYPELIYESKKEPNTICELDQSIAWKIFTRWKGDDFTQAIKVNGDKELGRHILGMNCLMIE
jgi:hypothetical protein